MKISKYEHHRIAIVKAPVLYRYKIKYSKTKSNKNTYNDNPYVENDLTAYIDSRIDNVIKNYKVINTLKLEKIKLKDYKIDWKDERNIKSILNSFNRACNDMIMEKNNFDSHIIKYKIKSQNRYDKDTNSKELIYEINITQEQIFDLCNDLIIKKLKNNITFVSKVIYIMCHSNTFDENYKLIDNKEKTKFETSVFRDIAKKQNATEYIKNL